MRFLGLDVRGSVRGVARNWPGMLFPILFFLKTQNTADSCAWAYIHVTKVSYHTHAPFFELMFEPVRGVDFLHPRN